MGQTRVASALLLAMLMTAVLALPSVLPKNSPDFKSSIDESAAHAAEEHATEHDDPLLTQTPRPSYEALVLALKRQPGLRASLERHRSSSTNLTNVLRASREAALLKDVGDGGGGGAAELRRAGSGDPCHASTNRICAAVRRIQNLTVQHAEHRSSAEYQPSNKWPTNLLFSSLNFANHHGNADDAATKSRGDSVSIPVFNIPLKESKHINQKLSNRDESGGTANAVNHAAEAVSPSPSPSRADVATAERIPRPTDAQTPIYHHRSSTAAPPPPQPASSRPDQNTNPDKHYTSITTSEAGPPPSTAPSSKQSSGSRHPSVAAPEGRDGDVGGAGRSDGPDEDSAPLVYRAISAEEVFKGAQRYPRRPWPGAADIAGTSLPGRRHPPSRRTKLFSCHGRSEGFYPDPNTGCQEYHQCTRDGRKFKYQCGGGTAFNVKTKVCDHPHSAECKSTPRKVTAS